MKHYYKVITLRGIEYWHGNTKNSTQLHKYGFVIPLGTRRPRNVSRETIKEF